MKKNIIIVGAGGSGSVIAREIATKLDLDVKIVERRNHIAGNMYDYYDDNGFLIQKYGPHHWYTSNYYIYKYMENFGDFFYHYYKSKNVIDNQFISMPFNFYSVQELVGRQKANIIIKNMRKQFSDNVRIPVIDLMNNTDKYVAKFGKMLFDKAFKTYITKMWDIPIEKIDAYVLGRRAFVAGYDERVADYDFQGLPKKGFTNLFRNMLNHPKIHVELNTDALSHISLNGNQVMYDNEIVDCLVYTGNIDELFGYKFGKLPYRSLDIRFEYFPDNNNVLPTEGVSYPQHPSYTRKIEFRKMMYSTDGLKGSVTSTEYPVAFDKDSNIGNIPYYPVVTKESRSIYNLYRSEAKKFGNIFLCGRLAEFKYIDMHTCISNALKLFKIIANKLQ